MLKFEVFIGLPAEGKKPSYCYHLTLVRLPKYFNLQLKILLRNIQRNPVITCREAPSHPTEREAADGTIFIDDDDSTSETEEETLNERTMALEMTTMSVAETREEDARRINEVNSI